MNEVFTICSKHINAHPKNYFVTKSTRKEVKTNIYVFCEERGKLVYCTGMVFDDFEEASYYCAEMNRLERKEKRPIWLS